MLAGSRDVTVRSLACDPNVVARLVLEFLLRSWCARACQRGRSERAAHLADDRAAQNEAHRQPALSRRRHADQRSRRGAYACRVNDLEPSQRNTPLRHHVVPRFYLDRWGNGDRRVYVRRRDGSAFAVSTRHVAVETGFYNIVDAAGKVSVAVERFLSEIEGAGAAALRGIDRTGEPPRSGSNDRRALASLLALQHTRSPELRA